MSAPTPAPGDDRPREGYYPDPSIPGYVRYWNGTAWVPGTSRPAPKDGEHLAPPPGVVRPAPPAVEETGPHFFDEDPLEDQAQQQGEAPARHQAQAPAQAFDPAQASNPAPTSDPDRNQDPHGSRPEPASAWGADRSQQSGFGSDQDRRVSWGAAQSADPRVSHGAGASGPAAGPTPAESTPADEHMDPGAPGSTFVFRRPTAAAPGTTAPGSSAPGIPAPGGPRADEGTMTFRPGAARAGQQGGAASGGSQGPGFGPGEAAAPHGVGAHGSASAAPSGPQQMSPTVPPQSAGPYPGRQPSAAANPVAPANPIARANPAAPAAPAAGAAAAGAPAPQAAGPGGGQASWAQQVHQLAAGEEQPVTPWRPPVDDPFQAMVRQQTAARPAALGKRLAARLLDTVVLGAVTAVAAVPLGARAIDHVNQKIDAAKLTGETVTVWLLDGTTSVHLGIVLAVLLLAGVVLEVLPTAKWGRTLGKRLLGLEVRDIEGHDAPAFGAALRRWLVYSVPGLLIVGLVGVLWCLFDRPWRQCWHDKAAHTFVAG